MVTSQTKNVSSILCIITQSSKKIFQYGIILLMAFCDISDNRDITLEIKKTESFYCRGINLNLLFNVPILKHLFLFYFFWLCCVFVAMYRLSLAVESGTYCLVAVCGLLTVAASLNGEHRL